MERSLRHRSNDRQGDSCPRNREAGKISQPGLAAAAHGWHTPTTQALLRQSAFDTQPAPTGHVRPNGVQLPPQSLPVSSASWTPSEQCAGGGGGDEQTFALQMPPRQSVPDTQPDPSGHCIPNGAQLPPQSLPVSSPSWTPSVHVAGMGAAQTPTTQLPLWQSLADEQPDPSGHSSPAVTQMPPQSTPVSLPSLKPSAHPGGTNTM